MKTDKKYEWEQTIMALVSPENVSFPGNSMEEIDDGIEAAWGMLDYYIEEGNKGEIAFCRRMLQKAKIGKRIFKAETINSEVNVLA